MARYGVHRLILIATYLASTFRQANGLIWEICRDRVEYALGNNTISLGNRTIFQPDATRQAPVLTLGACYDYCGPERSWYPDIGPILNAWLIPVLILVSQMEVAASDKRTYLVILHLLGDPIDSIYSLLLKVEAWSRCSRRAEREWEQIRRATPAPQTSGGREELTVHQRRQHRSWPTRVLRIICGFVGGRGYSALNGDDDLAKADFVREFGTFLGGIEEIAPEGVDPYGVYRTLKQNLPQVQSRVPAIARELANSRTDNIYRTCLAVALYFWQVIGAFISKVGGTPTSPPGGRIAISMFLTYVLPPILLSNVVANFPSQYTCYNIIQHHLPGSKLLHDIEAFDLSTGRTKTAYFRSRPWSGGTYTFRPGKMLFASGQDGDRSRRYLFILALCPLFVSTVTGLIIMWHLPPAGPNCRWFVILGISCVYILSFIVTWLMRSLGLANRLHWQLTHIKDFCIVVPTLLLLFASSGGLFNTCWCWSGVWTRGRAGAKIQLNTTESFGPYLDKLYPALFFSCLGLQLSVFAVMVVTGWDGLALMRWSRRKRGGLVLDSAEQSNNQILRPSDLNFSPQVCIYDSRPNDEDTRK